MDGQELFAKAAHCLPASSVLATSLRRSIAIGSSRMLWLSPEATVTLAATVAPQRMRAIGEEVGPSPRARPPLADSHARRTWRDAAHSASARQPMAAMAIASGQALAP